MPSNDPAVILAKAADVIEQRGLTYGEYVDRASGRVCALGALSVAAGMPADYWEGEEARESGPLWEAAAALADDVHSVAWPDDPDKEDVVTAIANWNDTANEAQVINQLKNCAEGLAHGAA